MIRCFRRSPAFTLIELLASCSIIAGSIALIVPAFGGNHSRARVATDNENLRTIAQLMATYSEVDTRRLLGPIHSQAFNFVGEGYAEYGGGPGTATYTGWTEAFDPRTRAFNYLLYGREFVNGQTQPGDKFFDEFRCAGEDRGWQKWPGFNGSAQETEFPYFKSNGTSFRMNNLLFFSNGGLFGCGIYGRSKVDVPSPGATIAFMEARVYQTLFTNDRCGTLPTHGELKGYHDRVAYFNVLFTDGHSAFADFGDGTFYEKFPEFQGFDVRGTWGRLDTLPAPSIGILPPPLSENTGTHVNGETPVSRVRRADR